MYADNETGSMKRTIDETNRRRKIQAAYNKKHGITPKSINKEVGERLSSVDPDAGKNKLNLNKIPKDNYCGDGIADSITHFLDFQ